MIEGRGGPDWMMGGSGNDRFVFTPTSGEMYGDRITDWNAGDRLDFSALDANPNIVGDQAFAFIGSAAFSGQAGQLRVSNNGTDTFVTGDLNGDGLADFSLTITGLPTLGPVADWVIL